MTVRTAYVGTQSSGDVLTSANFTKSPGGWIGYAEVTATQGSITTETDLTSLTLTVTVGSSRRIKVTGSVLAKSTVANDEIILRIKESTTQLQAIGRILDTNNISQDLTRSVILTPSGGSHTYKLSLARNSGSGTVTMDAGATYPAFILVEDLGPSS